MCGKLPGGSAGSVPSGRSPVASGIGVPHHGGAMSARAVAAPPRGTASVTTNTASKRRKEITNSPRGRQWRWLFTPACGGLHLGREVGGPASFDDALEEARRPLVARRVEDQVGRPLLEDHAVRHKADP